MRSIKRPQIACQKSIQHLYTWGILLWFLPCFWSCQTQHATSNTHKGFRPYPARAALKTSSNRPRPPQRIALLIGINAYRDKAWHPLRYARKDAHDLARVLRDKKLGKFNKILLYTRPDQTTRSSIQGAFAKLRRWVKSPKDTVFVYISAHGSLARDSQHQLRRFLITYDTLSEKVHKTGLSVRNLRRSFARLPSQRKVLLLATCHSGAGKSRFNRSMRAELKTLKGSFFVKPIENVSRATFVLGVCGFGETAQESPVLKNDIYTHYFIRAIRNRYDANGDGAVTLTEAHDYAKELTYYHTKGRQRPYADSDILGTDPIILVGVKRRLGKPVLYAYHERFNGVHIHVNGTAKGSFPRGVTVASGRQKIKLVSHDKKLVLFEGAFEFKAGQRIDVMRLFKRQFFPYAVAFKSGYQAFLQGATDVRFSKGLPLVGIEFKVHRPFSIPFDVRLEFNFARDSHVINAEGLLSQTVTEFNFGLAITYHLKWNFFTLYVGPRVSAIYLQRESNEHAGVNDFFYSFQPGVLLGTEFRVFTRWSFFLEGRLNYTYVTVESGAAQHQGSYEMLGGINFHF